MFLKKNYSWVALLSLYRQGLYLFLQEIGYFWLGTIGNVLMVTVFYIIGTTFSDSYRTDQLYLIGIGMLVMNLMSHTYFSICHYNLHLKVVRMLEMFVMSPIPSWLWLLSNAIRHIQESFILVIPFMIFLFAIGLPMPSMVGFFYAMVALFPCLIFLVCFGFFIMLFAEKWNDIAKWDNVVVVPVFMLSGAFFDSDVLPEQYRFLMEWNLFYQTQFGFRQAWFLATPPEPYIYTIWGGLALAMFVITCVFINHGKGLKT